MSNFQPDDIRSAVRDQYGRVAQSLDTTNAWCGASGASAEALAGTVGYSTDELSAVPAGANMGLGSGNPHAMARLQAGEAVLDLGSGGGVDCFLAAHRVGPSGRVVGVDMTPAMVEKARALALAKGFPQVEFVLGEIEHLPFGDAEFDAVMSNCVFNLSTDQPRAFAEAHRVLKPGGRLAFSDIVALAPLPPELRRSLAHHVGCMAGASLMSDVEAMLRAAGFEQIRIEPRPESTAFIRKLAPDSAVADFVVSAHIEATKPLA